MGVRRGSAGVSKPISKPSLGFGFETPAQTPTQTPTGDTPLFDKTHSIQPPRVTLQTLDPAIRNPKNKACRWRRGLPGLESLTQPSRRLGPVPWRRSFGRIAPFSVGPMVRSPGGPMAKTAAAVYWLKSLPGELQPLELKLLTVAPPPP